VPVELAIIVVNWNGGELLQRCLASVKEFPPSVSYEVVIVDNDSKDGSRQWLRDLGDEIRLIENSQNEGFGKANNRAFDQTEAQFLFLLNSDAEVKAGSIDILLSTLRSETEIGVTGPKLLNPDGTLQASVWQNPPTPFELLANAFKLYKFMSPRRRAERFLGYHWDHSYRRNAHLLSGAALMVKSEVIDDVGGFEERFHMYGEDTEWCLRVVRAGWLMVFEPTAIVVHHGGGSSSKRWTDLEKRKAEYLSFFRFQRLALSRRLMIGNLLSGWFASLAQVVWRFVRRKSRDEPRMAVSLYATELKAVLLGKVRVEK
jgi:GT2 family glycosyltransferase